MSRLVGVFDRGGTGIAREDLRAMLAVSTTADRTGAGSGTTIPLRSVTSEAPVDARVTVR